MTAAQTVMVDIAFLLGVIAAGSLLWRAATQHLRGIYHELGIPFDDAEMAACRAVADAQAWDEWVDICDVLGIDPDAGTSLYDRLVCEEIERQNGWTA